MYICPLVIFFSHFYDSESHKSMCELTLVHLIPFWPVILKQQLANWCKLRWNDVLHSGQSFYTQQLLLRCCGCTTGKINHVKRGFIGKKRKRNGMYLNIDIRKFHWQDGHSSTVILCTNLLCMSVWTDTSSGCGDVSQLSRWCSFWQGVTWRFLILLFTLDQPVALKMTWNNS